MDWKVVMGGFFGSVALLPAVEIRVATFNIGAHFIASPGGYYPAYSLGAAGTVDHDSVREILRRLDADVVALEEIHSVDISAGDVATLAVSLGYPYVFAAPATGAIDSTLHVAFLSRFPFLTQTAISSPVGAKDMTRLMPAVKVDVPGTPHDPVLVAAHLKSGSDASDAFQRTVEMRRLTRYLTAQGLTAADPFVMMGDFNLSNNDRVFTALPTTGLPGSFSLGADIVLPISYFTNPLDYFVTPMVSRIIPRQLDGSTVTFPLSSSTIDLFLVSRIIGSRPRHTEIYNSVLDSAAGIRKFGAPLAAGVSVAASDHFPLVGDFELDPAVPYTFTTPGQTVSESFANFSGTYDPYPWTTQGGEWQGMEEGAAVKLGFRSYGSVGDSSLGFLAGATAGTASADFVNGSASRLSALQISFNAEQWRSANGGTADRVSAELIVAGVALPLPELTFDAATNLSNGSVTGGISTRKSIAVRGLNIAAGAAFKLRFTFARGAGGGSLPAGVFINEFSYDDFGADTGEFVEVVVGPGYIDSLAAVSLVFYKADGSVSMTHSLASFTAGAVMASGHKVYSKLIPGILNGPNAVAVVVNGAVTQFISYEGVVTATAGAASGLTSTNIGVSQTGMEPEGEAALGLVGTGGNAAEFIWTKFIGSPYSAGAGNLGQSFTLPKQPQGMAIDDLAVTFLADSDGDGLSDADELVFGTDPQDASSRWVVNFSRPTTNAVRLAFQTVIGRTYSVESSVDLALWAVAASVAGTGGAEVVELSVSVTDAKRFFRVRVTQP
jgi:Endonuclease/Exonuclease/phosphatase family/Bacterial TSP3 repeat